MASTPGRAPLPGGAERQSLPAPTHSHGTPLPLLPQPARSWCLVARSGFSTSHVISTKIPGAPSVLQTDASDWPAPKLPHTLTAALGRIHPFSLSVSCNLRPSCSCSLPCLPWPLLEVRDRHAACASYARIRRPAASIPQSDFFGAGSDCSAGLVVDEGMETTGKSHARIIKTHFASSCAENERQRTDPAGS